MAATPTAYALVLNTADLAVVIKESIRNVHRLNSSGKIPRPCRLGGQLRWRPAEIEAAMPDRRAWERSRAGDRQG